MFLEFLHKNVHYLEKLFSLSYTLSVIVTPQIYSYCELRGKDQGSTL